MCHKLCAKSNESDKIFHLTKNMQNEKECIPQCLIENWNSVRKLHSECLPLLNILFEEGYVFREEIDSYLQKYRAQLIPFYVLKKFRLQRFQARARDQIPANVQIVPIPAVDPIQAVDPIPAVDGEIAHYASTFNGATTVATRTKQPRKYKLIFVHIENMKHWEIINTYVEVSQGRSQNRITTRQFPISDQH
jgi:hypothetical protein